MMPLRSKYRDGMRMAKTRRRASALFQTKHDHIERRRQLLFALFLGLNSRCLNRRGPVTLAAFPPISPVPFSCFCSVASRDRGWSTTLASGVITEWRRDSVPHEKVVTARLFSRTATRFLIRKPCAKELLMDFYVELSCWHCFFILLYRAYACEVPRFQPGVWVRTISSSRLAYGDREL